MRPTSATPKNSPNSVDPLNRVAAAIDNEAQAYEALRELVIGDERRGLNELEQRLDRVENGDEFVSRHLVHALRRNTKESEGSQAALAEAMAEPVEGAVRESVRRGQGPLSEALFPIIGPSVRIYVNELFRSLTDQLNETIRNTTSLRRLWWRIEAKLAGKSFSEYLLLKTLNYRTDEVFVIHRGSGLLIEHLVADHAKKRGNDERDASLVSGMLMAIRDFVQDSFSARKGDRIEAPSSRRTAPDPEGGSEGAFEGETEDEEIAELGRFTFGGRQVCLETGPYAIVAVVMEGSPPAEFQGEFQDVVAELHGEFGAVLSSYTGHADALFAARPLLRKLLVSKEKAETGKRGKRSLAPLKTVGTLLLTAAVALMLWNGWCERDWQRVEGALRAEPGIEILRVENAGFHRRKVFGLRDPLARDPREILGEVGGRPGKVEFAMTLFRSVGTPFEVQRIREAREREETGLARQRKGFDAELAALRSAAAQAREKDRIELTRRFFVCRFPDAGNATLEVDGANWKVVGSVEEPVYREILRVVPELPLDGDVDTSELVNATAESARKLREKIENTTAPFVSGESEWESGSEEIVAGLAEDILEFEKLNRVLGGPGKWFYELHALPLEGEFVEPNRELQFHRMRIFRRLLVTGGVPEEKISPDDVADTELQASRIGVYLRPFNREPEDTEIWTEPDPMK